MKKERNSVDTTLIGGFSSYVSVNGKRSKNVWQYTCLYGIVRICKGDVNGYLKVPGVTWSLHINTWGAYCWLPSFLERKVANYHIAFLKVKPYIVCGFENVSKYMNYGEC